MAYMCIITGIVVVGGLEAVALCKGFDGQLFASAIAAVLSLVGFLFGKVIGQAAEKKRGQK